MIIDVDNYDKTSLIAIGGFGISLFSFLLNLFHHGWLLLAALGFGASALGLYQVMTLNCKGKKFAILGLIFSVLSGFYCLFFWW